MARFWLTPALADLLLAAIRAGHAQLACSLDLGLSTGQVAISEHAIRFADDSELTPAQLREVADAKRGCFLCEDGHIQPIQISGDYFYKLARTDEAPTIEISGIQMHRTTGTAPFANAIHSARAVVRKGNRVLDTCGGLGYTAIAAARLGAAEVVSVELDPNVRAIARLNPWSAEYFSHPAITLVDGDAAEFVAAQTDNRFDRIIHDPPRFSRAGHLYGAEFYEQLARVLAPVHGRLFHYTGHPYSRGRGKAFVEGVVRRLGLAGFQVDIRSDLQGLVARRT